MKQSARQSKHEPFSSGQWSDTVSWEFYVSDELPDASLCTAVYCLAILQDTGQIVLTRNHRGWEMLGGHIDPGETIEQALVRESLEEGGFYPSRYKLFGYRKIMAREVVVNDHHGGTYPPIAFIPHFLAVTDRPLIKPTGEEILESRAFMIDEIGPLKLDHEDFMRVGLQSYEAFKMSLAQMGG